MTGNIVAIYGCLSANDTPKRSEPITYERISLMDEIRRIRIADERRRKQDMYHTLLRIQKLAEKLEGELQYYKTLSGKDTDSMMKSVFEIRKFAVYEMPNSIEFNDESAYKRN